MFALLVTIAAIHQQRNGPPPQPPQIPDQLMPDFYHNPKMPIGNYGIPVIGGEQEIVMGLKPLPMQFYGYYTEHGESYDAKGNMRFDNPQYYVQDKIGTMDWSVGTYTRDGKPATLLQTDGLYNQVLRLNDHRKITFTNRLKVSYWVAPDGTLLEMDSLFRVSAGNWSMQAIFNKDSYDLTLNDPINGERKSTLNLGFPLEKFNAMFKPMMDGKKVLLKEKDYYTLGPIYGRPIHCIAKLGGRWNGSMLNNKGVHGQSVDLQYGPYHQKIYVSDDGVLYRFDQSEHNYVSIEDAP